MKKYIIATILFFVPCIAYAITMCARDDSLVVALNYEVDGTSNSYNPSEFTWRADFPYGTLLGEATCLARNENGLGGGIGSPYIFQSGNMLSYDIPKALHGSNNGYTRGNCWCRITHPALSRWVFLREYAVNSGNLCTTNCAHDCSLIYNNPDYYPLRKGLFNAIGI